MIHEDFTACSSKLIPSGSCSELHLPVGRGGGIFDISAGLGIPESHFDFGSVAKFDEKQGLGLI